MDSQEAEEAIGYVSRYSAAAGSWNHANTEILRRLSQNDPDIQGLSVELYISDDGDYWNEGLGHAVSTSTHLRSISIQVVYSGYDPHPPPPGLPSFFMGLAENRSIVDLTLEEFNHSYMDIFTTLAPFFEHNHSLRSITLLSYLELSESVPSLISALLQTHGLYNIEIFNALLEDSAAADLITALTSMPGFCHLLELKLGLNKIGQQGCAALRKLLQHPDCRIQCLDISENHLDDVCMDILCDGLVTNKSIKYIEMDRQEYVTASGWGVFFDHFANSICSVETIDASENNIGDDGVISLGNSFVTNSRIKKLELGESRFITLLGWEGFSKGLRAPNCPLLKLYISDCGINDEGAITILSALGVNTALEKLNMSYNRNITSSGWVACFDMMMQYEIRLVELSLSGNNIDDVGARLLVTILVKMSKLKSFGLSMMTSVSAHGWREFADVLRPRSLSKLRVLNLGREAGQEIALPQIDDSVLICFAGTLISNTSLSDFHFGGYELSEVGRRALANSLCDTSSIIDTFCSNHTLQRIVHSGYYQDGTNRDLRSLLGMNNFKNKVEVARNKILATHFGDGDASLRIFDPMPTPTLPTALSWIGRDRREYSMMYYLLCSMPWLLKSTATASME